MKRLDTIRPYAGNTDTQSLGQFEYVSGMSPWVIALLAGSFLLTLITFLLCWVYSDLIPDKEITLVALLIGLIPLLCGLAGLKYVLNKESVKVYQNGFVYKSSRGRGIVLWSDIKDFYESQVLLVIQGVPVKQRAYTVTLKDGHKIVLEQNIRNVARIGDRLRLETFKLGYPEAYQKLISGKTLEFGRVTLTKNLLRHYAQEISLENIKRVKSVNGKIVFKGNSFFSNEIDYADTPNAHILFALLTELVEKKAS